MRLADTSPLPPIVQRRGYNIRDTRAASFAGGLVMILPYLCIDVQMRIHRGLLRSADYYPHSGPHLYLCATSCVNADTDPLYSVYIHLWGRIQHKYLKSHQVGRL